LERRNCLAPSGIRAPNRALGTEVIVCMDCGVEEEIGELNLEFVVSLNGGFSMLLLQFVMVRVMARVMARVMIRVMARVIARVMVRVMARVMVWVMARVMVRVVVGVMIT
jgi:hypothetical protein